MKKILLDSLLLDEWSQTEEEIQFVPSRLAPIYTPNTFNPNKEDIAMLNIINHPYFGRDLLPESRSLMRRMWTLGLIAVNPDAETEQDWDEAKLAIGRDRAKARYRARQS
tara:strand:+ start:313 stop:642 length:330 start_codon:yes stop_codon:yes gene_type:complete